MSDQNSEDGGTGERIADARRRSILKGLGAAGIGGLFGSSAVGNAAADETPLSRSVNTSTQLDKHVQRRLDADDINEAWHVDLSDDDQATADRNGDEDFDFDVGGTDVRPFVYTKGLADTGDPGQFLSTTGHTNLDEILKKLNDGARLTDEDNSIDVEIPGSGTRPLVAFPSAVSIATEGADAFQPTIPAPSEWDEGRTAAEMLEVYAMSLLREEDFRDLDASNPVVSALEDDLKTLIQDTDLEDHGSANFEWMQGFDADGNLIDADLLFRDPLYGCDVGPYVSQIFFGNENDEDQIGIGGIRIEPKIEPIAGVDESGDAKHVADSGPPFCVTEEALLDNINRRSGAEPGQDGDLKVSLSRKEPRYAHRGKDLASQVRDDPAYQPYLLAALKLLQWGASFDSKLPYGPNSADETIEEVVPYIDFGATGLLDLVARVCRNGLIAAWHQKWFVHRRLRPETYAYRVFDDNDYGLPSLLDTDSSQSASLFGELQQDHDNVLLGQMYPEGGPAHPAYPSGHSVIAGACATVLKTVFENEPIEDLPNFVGPKIAQKHYARGTPNRYHGGDTEDMTVHGEINKYASNIGMARIWAGVHYRSDHLYGLLLGQQVAEATLFDHFLRNTEVRATHFQNPAPSVPPVFTRFTPMYKWAPEDHRDYLTSHPIAEPGAEDDPNARGEEDIRAGLFDDLGYYNTFNPF